tara:strand:- start:2766 stop:3368 length:603 start_codon:yes stop_codon:yes gene_type:complete
LAILGGFILGLIVIKVIMAIVIMVPVISGLVNIDMAFAEKARINHPIKEIIIGGGGHDVGVFGHKKERGSDLNIEVRLLPIEWNIWRYIYSPTPHIGMHINTKGNTNQVFFGGNWFFDVGKNLFVGGSLGFAVHDGELDTDIRGRKDLGMQILFRESLEFGFRFQKKYAVSIMLDHISNASIDDQNEGLDTFGVRYGVSF